MKTNVTSAFILAAFCALTMPSHGAVYSIPGSYTTLQQAINQAPDGSTILVAPGTYTDSLVAVDLNKNLYFLGTEGAAATRIDGGTSRWLLQIINNLQGSDAKNLVFDGFTFENGEGSDSEGLSAITISEAKPVFLNCAFLNNHSGRGGAASIMGASTKVSFVGCRFTGNRGGQLAGAVLINGGHAQAVFKECTFEDNSCRNSSANAAASEGGALYFATAGGIVIDCAFRNNSCAYAGGAIMALTWWSDTADRVEVIGSRFEGNFSVPWPGIPPPSPTEAGAIMAEGNLDMVIDRCTFMSNWAHAGGAVASYRANLNVKGSVFDGNRAIGVDYLGFGGAIAANMNDAGDSVDRREAVVSIRDTMIRNGVAPTGGGLYFIGDMGNNKRGVLQMTNVVIEGCRATTNGPSYGNAGGMYVAYANCSADHVSLLRNTAESQGGGLVVAEASLSFINGIIAGNQCHWFDHAIHNYYNIPLTLTGTLFAYNGGSPAVSRSVLAAVPATTIMDTAYLAYFMSPYQSNPSITPKVGTLPNRGGYAIGSMAVANVTSNATFRLGSYQSTGVVASVTYAARFSENPYRGTPAQIPGWIEAENYDNSGEGISYHDTTQANLGGAYRPTNSVDIGSGTRTEVSGGYYVGWTEPGEWMEYSVFAPSTSDCRCAVRVASPAGGKYYIQIDGSNVTGTLTIPPTGGWGTWTSSVSNVRLDSGHHRVRIVVVQGGFNLDRIEMVRVYKPAGWLFYQWPYAYSMNKAAWYYFNLPCSQWRVNLSSGVWQYMSQGGTATGWNYFQWPYCYSIGAHNWFWFYTDANSAQWCVNLNNAQWSMFGQ